MYNYYNNTYIFKLKVRNVLLLYNILFSPKLGFGSLCDNLMIGVLQASF